MQKRNIAECESAREKNDNESHLKTKEQLYSQWQWHPLHATLA